MRLIGVLMILMVGTAAFAGGMETLIAPPSSSQSGRTAEFSVYIHNTGGETLSVRLPARLSCLIISAGRTVEMPATAVPPSEGKTALLGEGSFLKGRYVFTVPEGMEGPVSLQVRDLKGAATVIFIVTAPAKTERSLASAALSEPPIEDVTLDSLFGLYQPYLVNLSAYEPLYFLVGTKPEKSKFQISFKYRLLNPAGELVTDHPWLKGLHFGYTQTSFWDLKSDSAPFEDTSYKPELFFVSPNIKMRPSWMKGLFLKTGFQHESNGRGGEDSRSANFFYLKPMMIFYDPATRYGLQIAPKIWTYLNSDEETTPDLRDYRGYFDLDIKVGKADGFVLGSSFRWAARGASIVLDLTYPIRPLLFQNIDLYAHLQYVNALAEGLLHYRERTEALRLGFSIVR